MCRMETTRKSRLFTLPPDLLFVDEDIGIVLPTLEESQHTAPAPAQEEEEEDDDEEDLAKEPARVFVGLPVTFIGPLPEDEEEDDDFVEDAAEDEAPLFLAPEPPKITMQLPVTMGSLVALSPPAEESDAPTPTPAPAPVAARPAAEPEPSVGRSLGLALALAAAVMLLVFWG